ncbi:phenylacetate--CoA ligase family protein [Micromonospora radicis]|uniref:phenylacetate--CoA ligase family protein n=1 Tax=Micromonospora radicis TaxID=1894971 RepID=UPI0011C435E3|nr:phenylacetate--CoA ligase family protein [Micromonospora radicis]
MHDRNRRPLGSTTAFAWPDLDRHEEIDDVTRALELFQDAAATVPAYRDFLSTHGLDPATIRTAEQFAGIPPLCRDTYQDRYPLPQLCRGGRLDGCDMVAVSANASGQSTAWPRSVLDEMVVSQRFEQVMQGSFQADRRRTLAVVGFAMGSCVSGMYTAACWRHLTTLGYPLTIATPGANVAEILRVVTELGPHFEQVVLAGCPSFVSLLVAAGAEQGLDWPRYSVRLMLAGEPVDEEWRDQVCRTVGMTDPTVDSAWMYGTDDVGVLGNETPLSIAIRRFLAGHPPAARELFGTGRLPTLVQYDPTTRYLEVQGGRLLVSYDGEVPLIRYHLGATGGIVPYHQMLDFCREWNFDPSAALRPTQATLPNGRGTPPRGLAPLPFVYVCQPTITS